MMNTKKLILALGAATMLASCGGSSLTRADAEAKLDEMYTTATGTSFSKPATILSTKTTTKDGSTSTVELDVDSANGKVYYKSTSGSTTVEAYIYKDTSATDAVYYVAYNDGTSKTYASSLVAATYPGLAFTALFTTVSTYSRSMANFLRNFDDVELYKSQSNSIADSDVTGTTKFWDRYDNLPQITDEKYTSNGEGHLYLEGNYRYSYTDENGYVDEVEQMEWKDSLLTLCNNEKSGVKDEYSYGGEVAAFDKTGYTLEEDTLKVTALVAQVGVLVGAVAAAS